MGRRLRTSTVFCDAPQARRSPPQALSAHAKLDRPQATFGNGPPRRQTEPPALIAAQLKTEDRRVVAFGKCRLLNAFRREHRYVQVEAFSKIVTGEVDIILSISMEAA